MKGPILVSGYGSIARRHIANLRRLGVREILLHSRHAAVGAPPEGITEVFGSLEEALSRRPIAALLCGPTSTHLERALVCAEAGCHLFIEKPLAAVWDPAPWRRLARLASRKKLAIQVGYVFRHSPLFRRVERAVASGRLGRVLSARCWSGQHLADWHPGEDYRKGYMARRSLGGGIIATMSHELDMLLALLGRPSWVWAAEGEPGRLGIETESLAEVTLGYPKGVLAQAHLDALARGRRRGLELVGTKADLVVDWARPSAELHLPGGRRAPLRAEPGDLQEAFVSELRAFLKAAQGRAAPRPGLAEGLDALRLIAAARRSASSGRRESF